jgi:RNA polymerase sigma-70 factor, ECF subfamily
VDHEEAFDLFTSDRCRLLRIANGLVGEADSEDAVQQTLLAFAEAKHATIDNGKAWLTTVLKNHCRDELRYRRLREREVARSLHEYSPDGLDPMEVVILLDRVSEALLIVLQNLAPSERAVFVLHDVFAMDFHTTSSMLGRTEAACRQLAHRARRHLHCPPRFAADVTYQRQVVSAFRNACSKGDFDLLLALLDPSLAEERLVNPN